MEKTKLVGRAGSMAFAPLFRSRIWTRIMLMSQIKPHPNIYSSAVFCWYIIYQGLVSQCQAIRNVNVGCSWLVWAVCMEVCIWKSCSLVNVFNLLRCVVPDNFLSSNVVRPLSTLSSFLDGHPSPSWLKAIALPYIYEPVHSSCKAKAFT